MMYTMPKNLLSICVNFALATQRTSLDAHRPAEPYGDFGRPIYLKGSERGRKRFLCLDCPGACAVFRPTGPNRFYGRHSKSTSEKNFP